MLSNTKTVSELFEYAIALEKAAETLYLELEKMFSHYTEVASFWHSYANEENGHASYLENIKTNVDANRLSNQADEDMLKKVLYCLEQSSISRLVNIKTLDDAHKLAVELENSETNAIFEFMIVNFSTDELAKSHKFLRAQLSTHITRLENDFPYKSRITRQGILALK